MKKLALLFLLLIMVNARAEDTASIALDEAEKTTKKTVKISKPATRTVPKLTRSRLLTALPHRPPAPLFELPDDEGDMHALSDYKGKTVIINFWATWCPPCRAELPSMNRAWAKLKNHDVQMLAVNVGEDEDSVFAFTGEQEIDFQILLDESGEIINRWPVDGLPTTFILDKQGRVVYRAVGGREWDADEIVDIIKNLK